MRHASVELVEAMRGTALMAGVDELSGNNSPHQARACSRERFDGDAIWGWDADRAESVNSNSDAIDCPDCLKLMLAARGPDADYLAERAA